MELYPAIDLRAGRVVRLAQGDYARETAYAHDPVALASAWARDGARWLHLVDLDGARAGRYGALELLARIRAETGLAIQTGGGVRDEAQIEALIAAGASRVVIGSVAVRDPALVCTWLVRYGPERLCLALDARQDGDGVFRLPVRGWTEDSGVALHELLARLRASAPLRHVLCTDIERDGVYAGPNLALYRDLAAREASLLVQASGGVRDAADVRALREAGAGGAIVGRALVERRVALAELLAC